MKKLNNKILEDIKNNKKIIIIADNDYLPILLKYKNIKANIKLMPYKQAISSLTFEINEAMIATLIKNGTEYTKAKQILTNLQLLTKDNLDKAPKVLSDAYKLVKPLLTNTGYDTSYIFKNKEIYLFNAKDDVQLINLFKSKGLTVNHLGFEDLGIKQQANTKEVINFDNKLQQYMYVFGDIRKKITQKPELANKIRILIEDEYDLYYVTYFANMFKIRFTTEYSFPLYIQPSVINALKYFYNKKSLDYSEIRTADPTIVELKRIIECYGLKDLEFEQGYLNLVELCISTEYIDKSMKNTGIIVSNKYVFDNDLVTYCLAFQDDIFYESFKDTDVITDVVKKQLNINPSYLKTLVSKQKMKSFVLHNNIALLSRVKQHLDKHIYDSRLIGELNLKTRPFNFSNEDDLNELLSLSFTTAGANMLAGILREKNFDTSKFPEVDSYNNQPINLKVKNKEKYSITDIQDYSKCPFKYLLDHELRLFGDDDKYYAHLGTLVHSVLEHIQDGDFDYDKLFDKAYEQFKLDMTKQCHGSYDKKYDVFVSMTKKWFKYIVNEYRARITELPYCKIYPEVEFNFTIPETDNKFKGIIDGVMVTKSGNNTFYSIVDYKTGSDVFSPLGVCCGQNIQLPMYFGALDRSDKADLVKNMNPAGFGLKKVLANSPKKFTNGKEQLTLSNLNAFIRNDIYAIDDENFDKSILIYGTNKKGQPTTKGIDQLVSIKNDLSINIGDTNIPYTIADLVKQANNVALETIDLMKQSLFPIMSTAVADELLTDPYEMTKDETNCKYCKYADICYMDRRKDFFDQRQRVVDKWLKSKIGGNHE